MKHVWLVLLKDYDEPEGTQTKISRAFTNRDAAKSYEENHRDNYDETVVTKRILYEEDPTENQ